MVKKIRIKGTDALKQLKQERGEKYIEPWYAVYVGTDKEFDVDSVFNDVYIVIDDKDGRYKSVIKGDGKIVEEKENS